MSEIDEFRQALKRFVTQPCWRVGTSAATGSHFNLNLGGKLRRIAPLKNPHVSEEVRQFTGEFGLHVYGAAWRVQTSDKVVGSWRDPGPSDGPMGQALKCLVGKRVTAASVEVPALDLVLDFDDDLTLWVFSDGTARMDDTDYTVFTPRTSFTVGMGGELVVTPRPTAD